MCKHLTHKGFRQFVAGANSNCPLLSRRWCEEGFGDEYQTANSLFRITVTAIGRGAARYSVVAVMSGDFRTRPRM